MKTIAIVFSLLMAAPVMAEASSIKHKNQTRTLLRNNGFNPINIEISRPESPIIFIAEAIIDSVEDEKKKILEKFISLMNSAKCL